MPPDPELPHRHPPEGTSGPAVRVLTGPTSGIGLATARALARSGGVLVLVGRRPDALRALSEELGRLNTELSVELHVVDLTELRSVRRVAEAIRSAHPRVDVLINNAGAYFHDRATTSEGVERTFALNVLAPFLLTRILEASLVRAAPSRVVMVSSAAHRFRHLRMGDLEARDRYSGFAVYGRSKLALLLLTYQFAERWRPLEIDVNALHPGFVATRFGHNNSGFNGRGMAFLTRVFGRSPERGAETEILLATSPNLLGVTGQYFVDKVPSRSSGPSYDLAAGERLWAECNARLREVVGEGFDAPMGVVGDPRELFPRPLRFAG